MLATLELLLIWESEPTGDGGPEMWAFDSSWKAIKQLLRGLWNLNPLPFCDWATQQQWLGPP